MNEKINDGGSAFPQITTVSMRVGNESFMVPQITGGMSLRAWFAGQALVGMASDYESGTTYERSAQMAVAYADALIAELEKPRG